MSTRLRLAIVLALVLTVGVVTWLVTTQATPEQSLSLAVLVDTGTETVRSLDRLGKLATEVTLGEEERIGAGIAAAIEAGGGDPEGAAADQRAVAAAYAGAVVAELQERGGPRRSGVQYRVKVLGTSEINAFAVAGGHLYITTAMLGLIESEAELAAVLGHEMAHVDLKHCIERIQYEHAAAKLGGEPLEAMVGIGAGLVSIGFADDLEREADRMGTIYAAHAGYHPQGGQLVFQRLLRLSGARPEARANVGAEVRGMLEDALEGYFRTHPKASERIAGYDRVFREQGFELDSGRYYVGRQNYADMQPRAARELDAEWVTGRIFPPR